MHVAECVRQGEGEGGQGGRQGVQHTLIDNTPPQSGGKCSGHGADRGSPSSSYDVQHCCLHAMPHALPQALKSSCTPHIFNSISPQTNEKAVCLHQDVTCAITAQAQACTAPPHHYILTGSLLKMLRSSASSTPSPRLPTNSVLQGGLSFTPYMDGPGHVNT